MLAFRREYNFPPHTYLHMCMEIDLIDNNIVY